MPDYCVTRILSDTGVVVACSKVFLDVELRMPSHDLPDERDFYVSSFKSFGLDESVLDLDSRVSVIVSAEDLQKAIVLAGISFQNFISIYSSDIGYAPFSISEAGIVRDLETEKIYPILNSGFSMGRVFQVERSYLPKYDEIDFLLRSKSELSDRLKRSYHWSQKSRLDDDVQLQILFKWFAMETLFKEDSDQNCVESMVRMFLGFPNGRYSRIVSKSVIDPYLKDKRYLYWSKNLHDICIRIRNFRNDSVHDGFRYYDFDESEVVIFNKIMNLSLSRAQGAVRKAIIQGVGTISEFKDGCAKYFDSIFGTPHLIDNILWALDDRAG